MILSFILAFGSLVSVQLETSEVPVLHVRPSTILRTIKQHEIGASPNHFKATADDVRGSITIVGMPEDIHALTTIINMFDVSRRSVKVSLKVDSDLDRVAVDSSASLLNQQTWTSSDSDTGISVGLTPRINDDNTVTIMMDVASRENPKPTRVVFRIHRGEMREISMADLTGNVSPAPKLTAHGEDVKTPLAPKTGQAPKFRQGPRILVSVTSIGDRADYSSKS